MMSPLRKPIVLAQMLRPFRARGANCSGAQMLLARSGHANQLCYPNAASLNLDANQLGWFTTCSQLPTFSFSRGLGIIR